MTTRPCLWRGACDDEAEGARQTSRAGVRLRQLHNTHGSHNSSNYTHGNNYTHGTLSNCTHGRGRTEKVVLVKCRSARAEEACLMPASGFGFSQLSLSLTH